MGGEPLGLQYVHHVECQKCRWTRKTVLISVLILTANGNRQNRDKRGHIVVLEPASPVLCAIVDVSDMVPNHAADGYRSRKRCIPIERIRFSLDQIRSDEQVLV